MFNYGFSTIVTCEFLLEENIFIIRITFKLNKNNNIFHIINQIKFSKVSLLIFLIVEGMNVHFVS